MRVEEIMTPLKDLPIVEPNTVMSDALLVMTEKNLGSVLIVKDGNLEGIITDGDLKRHMDGTLLSKTVDKIMSTDPKSITKDVLAVASFRSNA